MTNEMIELYNKNTEYKKEEVILKDETNKKDNTVLVDATK